MKTSKIFAAIYLTFCFFLATGEPKEDAPTYVIVGYYLFVLANFCLAAYLTNKSFKKYGTTTAANGNRIPERADGRRGNRS